MFYYFGFGSNMSMTSLRAKGVEPIKSFPAYLIGWRLRFNVEHFFRHEGGVGNIEHTGEPQDIVWGVLHECPDESLAPLDGTEAYGYGYDRITIEVNVKSEVSQQDTTSQKDTRFSALTYVGMPAFIDNTCLPSQRYLNIILEGAEQSNLPRNYIQLLQQQKIHEPQDYPEYIAPQGEFPTFDAQSLAKYPLYTALKGHVFDMTHAREHHEYLKQFFGGKDMTLFHLKRLDCSNSQESMQDIKEERFNLAQRKYLNSFLNEYALEYGYVGHFTYHHE